MRSLLLGVMLVLGLIHVTALNGDDAPAAASVAAEPDTPVADKAPLQLMYMEFLASEGYKPEVDDDGDVLFKREGKAYFIGVDASDPQFFRIVLPNFWEINNYEEHFKVLSAADYANNRSKVTKVFVVQQNTWASVELFVNKPEDFKPLFSRAIEAVDNGVSNFVAYIEGQATR